jgi:hypothetical protein
MPNEDHRASPSPKDATRRYLLLGALSALVIVGVALFVLTRDDDLAATSPSATSRPVTTAAPSPTKDPSSKSEIITRLREILQVREQAFKERDASLFDEVYASTCPCLRAGRDAIAALKKENIRWRNRSVSIKVQSAKSISDNLWEVVALFSAESFRIETEEGILVRQAPEEHLRYRFLLVRNSGLEPWRLGNASSIEG